MSSNCFHSDLFFEVKTVYIDKAKLKIQKKLSGGTKKCISKPLLLNRRLQQKPRLLIDCRFSS